MASPVPSTPAQIDEILQQLDGLQQAPMDERRVAPRLTLRMTLRAIMLNDTTLAEVAIYTRDISISGIGFVSRRLFKPGERLAIPLSAGKAMPRLVLAEVQFARYVRKGLHQMGAQFLEAINDPTGAARVPARWLYRVTRTSEPLPGGEMKAVGGEAKGVEVAKADGEAPATEAKAGADAPKAK